MPLGIEHLEAHGISRRVLEIWRADGIAQLLPLQEEAVMRTGVLQNRSVIVFAPTSSGKTFIAEMAAIKHLESHHRVVYLVPTKALAEEKYRRFTRLYRPLGYRVLVATRERPETDQPALKGRFDLLIAVYEKMKSYLVQKPTLLSHVGLVTADEIQMLGEPERGGVVDLLLTKITQSPYKVQFLGLSAVLGDVLRIARWLDCDFLKETRRPVELYEGVYNVKDGRFYSRAFNTGEEKIEPLTPGPLGVDEEEENFHEYATLALARHLVQVKGEQVLIFVPTRFISRLWAEKLSAALDSPAAQEAIAELEKYEETHTQSALLSCFRKGVAFHNADLSWNFRKLIEDEYNAGHLRALVSTSTLGEGVNLTGKNVIQLPEMVRQDEWTGQVNFVPLSQSRFRNQGGRAGRLGLESDFGRSILIAAGEAQVERLMREYVYGELEPIQASLARQAIAPFLLDLVSSRICLNIEELDSFLLKTYTGLTDWSAGETEFLKYLTDEVKSCADHHFLTIAPEGSLSATGIGTVTAVTGVRLETASLYTRWLRELKNRAPSSFEALLVTSLTPDAAEFSLPVYKQERRNMDISRIVREYLPSDSIDFMPFLKEILDRPGGYTEADFSALKKTLVLHEWISMSDTSLIEERFGLLSGMIMRLADHFSWLLHSSTALAEALGIKKEIPEFLARLAKSLRLGVGEPGLQLGDLCIPGLERNHIQILIREGYDSLDALKEAEPERLKALLPEHIVNVILEELQGIDTGEKDLPSLEKEEPEPVPSLSKTAEEKKPLLLFRLSEPGMIECAGTKHHLTPLPYHLLLTLARRPGQMVSYITIDEEVWPEQKVERQQVSFHRAALMKILAQSLGRKRAGKLIKTYSGQGLVLDLSPEDIEILP